MRLSEACPIHGLPHELFENAQRKQKRLSHHPGGSNQRARVLDLLDGKDVALKKQLAIQQLSSEPFSQVLPYE